MAGIPRFRNSMLFTAAVIAPTVGALQYAAGNGEAVCGPIIWAANELDNPETPETIPIGLCDDLGKQYLPPETIGQGRLRVASELGKMVIMANVAVTQEGKTLGVLPDTAEALGWGEVVKVWETDKIIVDWRAAQEDGIVLVTQMQNGQDTGVDMSSLRFKELQPEYDMSDGVVDGDCLTDVLADPDTTGCWTGDWFDNGYTKWADLGGDIIGRLERITTLKVEDDTCLLMHALPSIAAEKLLNDYQIVVERNYEGAQLMAKILLIGLIKEQVANALGEDFPIQRVMVRVNPETKMDLGLTYPQRLAQERATGRLGNMTDADSEEDWCLVSGQSKPGFVVAQQRIHDLIDSAFAKPGWDHRLGKFLPYDARHLAPEARPVYEEAGYA